MKTKKLNKRLDRIEASLNCLRHYLIEQPLDREMAEALQVAEAETEAKEEFYRNFEGLLPESFLINHWTNFRVLKDYFPDYSSLRLRNALKEYCEGKEYILEFQKKLVKLETGHSIALDHFIIVT